MRSKRFISAFLLIVFLMQFGLAQFVNIPFTLNVQAASENVSTRYFYDQLDEVSKEFYDAMYNMYVQGIFKVDGDYDLVENGHVTQEQLKEFAKGDKSLLYSMGAARDAFYYDHPEVFYVDFDYLSMRVTTDSSGKYFASLGKGRSDTYLRKGFKKAGEELNEELEETYIDDAINEVDNIVNDIIENVPTTVEEGKNLTVEQIKYVHNKIINTTTYRLDSSNKYVVNEKACTPGYEGFVRTAYGVFVKHESLCEGYSRAMKYVLDKLNIPCVLVYGTYVWTSSDMEQHMWNYVQVDGKWYAIDATFDDPRTSSKLSLDYVQDPSLPKGVDTYENEQFLLVGQDLMSKHREDGVISQANFKFEYPEIEINTYGLVDVSNNQGLDIKILDESLVIDGVEVSQFKISYEGLGVEKAKEKGIYFLYRSWDKNPAESDNSELEGANNWSYVLPDMFPSMLIDSDVGFTMNIGHIPYMQFAVTDVAPGPYKDGMPGSEGLTELQKVKYLNYLGDFDSIISMSDIVYNENGYYVPAPQLSYCTPYFGSCLEPGRTYHVTFGYDEKLVLKDGVEKPNLVWNYYGASASDKNAKVENFQFNDDYTKFEFDFTPSSMWADMGTWYYFQVKGVVGETSNREPVLTKVGAIKYKPCLTSQKASHNWDMFARPTYVSSNITIDAEDGTKQLLDNNTADYRITLVTSEPAKDRAVTMRGLMDEKIKADKAVAGEKEVLATTMWDLDLIVCNKDLVQPERGDKVTISLGFPEGYGPEDEGVIFKAYHYIVEYGEIVGVEEIPCVVTQYGLLITCNSFSPFAIAAVKANSLEVNEDGELVLDDEGNAIVDTSKSVSILQESMDGKVEVDGTQENTVSLKEGETKQIRVTANEGYVIESIEVNGVEKVVETGVETQVISIKYDEISKTGMAINVKYVAKLTQQAEEEAGKKGVTQAETSGEIVPEKEYKLNTQVNGVGGTISGQDEEVYETIKENGESTKQIIVTPDEKYKVSSIKVNGKDISFDTQNDGTVVLSKFVNVKTDINIVVTFEKKDAKVVAKYLEVGTEKVLASEVSQIGKVDEDYTTINKIDEINTSNTNKYELVKVEGKEAGKYLYDEQVVTYWYKKIESKVVIKYIDESNGNEIAAEEYLNGYAGDKYTINPKEFDGYTFSSCIGQIQGEFTEEQKEVVLCYEVSTEQDIQEPSEDKNDVQENVDTSDINIILNIMIVALSIFGIIARKKVLSK